LRSNEYVSLVSEILKTTIPYLMKFKQR
jgi:hypothetical protein